VPIMLDGGVAAVRPMLVGVPLVVTGHVHPL
jgi:hypothetical protein